MQHYFISELLIVLVGLWAARAMWQGRNYSAMLGFLCFVIAAGIGVYRFGLGQIEPLAGIHKTAGQLGGLAGIWLLTLDVLIVRREKRDIPVSFVVLLAAILLAKLKPALAVPTFVIGAAALPIVVLLKTKDKKALWGLGAAIMLPNILLVRRSAYLGPDLSWHLFHTLIAVWLLVLGVYFKRHIPTSSQA